MLTTLDRTTNFRLLRTLSWAIALGLLGLALAPARSSAAPALPAGFQDEAVASLDRPVSLAFTPDRRLLIGTVPGKVRVHQDGSLLGDAALDISSKVCSDSERGLMAVAVDPAFTANHYIYVYYTHKKHGVCPYAPSAQLPVNRISRFVLGDENVADPASETVLIDNIPAPTGYHIGADLGFGKDGYLYASTGDGGCDYADPDWCDEWNDASRDQHILLGKVLRITRDGAIPPTNPYRGSDSARCNVSGGTTAGKKCQETFAWGLRNPFRIAFDPNVPSTRFFINDVGEITWEEIDLGQAGADYGWNVREGPCATGSTTDCGAPPAGMVNPIHAYEHDFSPGGCTSITGGAFVPVGAWPAQYDASYLYADLACGKIFELAAGSGGAYSASEFATGFGEWSLISLAFGPHGSGQALYYVTWNGPGQQVRRISYTGPPRGYARPQGAAQLRVPLALSYRACASPNRTHGPALDHPSCSPAVGSSPYLTIGTQDANGLAAQSSGFVAVSVCAAGTTASGRCSTPAGMDAPDVRLEARMTDVRCKGSAPRCQAGALSDYTGELQASGVVRITDKHNSTSGGTGDPATVTDFPLSFTVPCTANAAGGSAGAIGATCGVLTSLDAVRPGALTTGTRGNWELDALRLLDGGSDGLAGTAGNAELARQGVFVP